VDERELWDLINKGENAELECKSAVGGLPDDVWETYSSFANTDGGIILLGIKEDNEDFIPQQINVSKVLKKFWDTINNQQKISHNILTNDNITTHTLEEKEIIKIYVPRANREKRPVYKGQNPLTGTYRRNFEGDYRCGIEEVKRMIADQQDSQDNKVLDKYSLNDVSDESLKSYRNRFSSLKPDHPWNAYDKKDFLLRIGAWGADRETGKEGLTVAGLLMFGEEWAITSYFPNYFLDYRERFSDDADERWSDRVISQDGTWSGNVYDFYFKIIGKLTSNINVPFMLEEANLLRKSETSVHKALREALVNTLVHSDYSGDRGIVVEKEKMYFKFSNPGTLRVSLRQAKKGGVSDPRNKNMFKIFSLLGLGERAGSGIENIHKAWKDQHWKAPELYEEFQPDRTVLVLRTISLLPEESLAFLKAVLEDKFEVLNNAEVLALVTAHQEGEITNMRLQTLTDKYPSEANKLLTKLVDDRLLVSNGHGRGTKYLLSEIFHEQEETEKQNQFSNIQNIGVDRHVKNLDTNIDNNDYAIEDSNNHINHALAELAINARNKKRLKKDEMDGIILQMCSIKALTLKELSELLSRNSDTVRKGYLNRLLKERKLELKYPDNINHPMQAYKAVQR